MSTQPREPQALSSPYCITSPCFVPRRPSEGTGRAWERLHNSGLDMRHPRWQALYDACIAFGLREVHSLR